MIGALIEGAIKRRKVVLGVTLIASIFGLIAYNTMPREANPNIDLPFVAIIVPYPGVSPEDSERLLVRPLETNLQSIEGIKILHVDGLANGGSGGNGQASQSAGIADQAVDAALRYRSQAPLIDALLNELGLQGGSLNGLVSSAVKPALRDNEVGE